MKTFASIAIVVFLTFALPLTVLLYRIDTFVLLPEPLLRTAEQNNLYESIIPTIADTYMSDGALREAGVDFLPRDQAITVLSSTFTPAWVRLSATQIITELYRLRQPGTTVADLHLTIPLSEPKAKFLEALSTAALPTGSDAFYPVLIAAALPEQINLLHAIVPAYAQVSAYGSQDSLGLKRFGSALTADEQAALLEQQPKQLAEIQTVIAKTHTAIPALLGICAILFATIILLNIGHGRHTLRWTAASTCFPGIVFLLLGLSDDLFIMPLFESKLSAIPSAMHTLARSLATSYTSQFFDFFIILGVAGMGISIACVIVGLLEQRKQHSHLHNIHHTL